VNCGHPRASYTYFSVYAEWLQEIQREALSGYCLLSMNVTGVLVTFPTFLAVLESIRPPDPCVYIFLVSSNRASHRHKQIVLFSFFPCKFCVTCCVRPFFSNCANNLMPILYFDYHTCFLTNKQTKHLLQQKKDWVPATVTRKHLVRWIDMRCMTGVSRSIPVSPFKLSNQMTDFY
jgi:hypothetical protein